MSNLGEMVKVSGWLSALRVECFQVETGVGIWFRVSWLKFTVQKEGKEQRTDPQGSAKGSPNVLFRLSSNTLLDHFQFSV